MDRRTFLKQGMAVSVATAMQAETKPLPAGKRPMNVLYAFSDQHRAASLPGEAFNQAIAPNIDNFRRKSFSMDRCISNFPLCSPYRGIFMSGAWPYQSGMINNGLQLGNRYPSIGETFARNGYHTGYVGKWHLSSADDAFTPPGPKRQGFEDWHVWCSTDHHYTAYTFDQHTGQKIAPTGYSATHMTDEAITFLKAQQAEKPWFLVMSWNPPHPPFDPPKQQMNMYDAGGLKLRPNVQVGGNVQEAELRRLEQGYYGAITAIDLEFARLMQTLEETGQAENTIVIYTSDHGEMMGAQGWMGKRLPHDESCHVPFFVHYPGVTPAGGSSEILFAAIDIYPTLCGLAGFAVPQHCGGKDLSAAMRGKMIPSQDAVFLMNITHRGERDGHPPDFRGIRTQAHTYAVAEDGRWCLYDNLKDPYQLKNLITDPDMKPIMAHFDAQIATWLRTANDPFPYAQASQRLSTISVHDNMLPKKLRKGEASDTD